MDAGKSSPNYQDMSGATLLEVLGDDARQWAAAFCAIYEARAEQGITEEWMTTWFANAMENAWDVRTRRAQPPTQIHPFPDLGN